MAKDYKYCDNPEAEVPKLFIDKEIGGKDADGAPNIQGNEFLKELMFLSDTEGKGKIDVWINSPGGVVTEGQSIYASILASQANVDTVCYGIAASIAGVIFQAGRKRKMFDYATLMYHPAYSEDGTVDKGLEALNNAICKMIATRTGKTEDEIWKIMNRGKADDKGTWIGAEEALANGFCDEIIKSNSKNKAAVQGETATAVWRAANKVLNRTEDKSTTIQTIVIDKEKFSRKEAVKWCKDHDFKTEVDETEESYRFRQRNPGDFIEGSFRTIDITTGVKAVIGKLKDKKKSNKMKSVLNKLGLIEDANEASAIEAIQSILNKKSEAEKKYDEKCKEMEDLKKELADLKKKMDDEEADRKAKAEEEDKKAKAKKAEDDDKKADEKMKNAVASGKVKNDPAIIAAYKALLIKDFEGTEKVIDALPGNKTSPSFTPAAGSIPDEDEAHQAVRRAGHKPGSAKYYNALNEFYQAKNQAPKL